ncbi:MAG: (4Fe-4S)-binding protein, partial [Thermoplasmata archaeon]
AKKLAEEKKKDIIIIDGPPGIGCPVISAITGVDLVLVVTEPTLSAIHDLERILKVSDHFDVPSAVCVNKYDINLDNTSKIVEYCAKNNVPLISKLPYDTIVTNAMIHEKTIIEFSKNELSDKIRETWKKIREILI